ncbi:MAG: hypothetical protein OEY06_10320 [Gammaproteobacteria bacterium]|nr:hypothetical protein [Gammaproteobacteria bacterium]
MHTLKILFTLFCILIMTSNAYAEDNKIEISEYLDHLQKQFIASKLVNSEQGSLIHQGKAHVELNVVTTKNKKGEIQSYVVQDNGRVKAASVQKLSFDIDVSQSQQKPITNTPPDTNTTPATPTASATAPVQKQTQPWYKHFFTW